MSDLRLHFHNPQQPDLPLALGMLSLGSQAGALVPVEAGAPWLIQFCNDRRGVWMAVAEGVGVHVNGRPVQKLVMLRAGDNLHIGSQHVLLYSPTDNRAPNGELASPFAGVCPRLILRGVSGPYHGRSFCLQRPCVVGSAAEATLRIEGEAIAPRHATISIHNGQALLHSTAGGVQLNGRPVREAILHPGDQLVFSRLHRFVLEGSLPSAVQTPPISPEAAAQSTAKTAVTAKQTGAQRASWLLATALLLASALALLLVFGAH